MNKDFVHIQENDVLHLVILVLDKLQFHDHKNILVLDIVVVLEPSNIIQLRLAEDTLNLTSNAENLDLIFVILLSELIGIVAFLAPILEIDSDIEVITLHINLHQENVHDLRPHLEDLLKTYNQTPLKIITITLTKIQSQRKNLKVLNILLNWNKLVFYSVNSLSKR